MKLFKFSDLIKSWSVWGLSAITALPILAENTEWVSAIVPKEYQPMALSILGAITLIARAIKQKPEGVKMACNGCGTSAGLTKEQVENLINKLIDEGKLQAGLKDCDGAELPKGTKLVLCSAFADMVKELIEKGTIDVVSDVKVEDGKIVVVDGTGKETKLATPFVSDLAFDATTNKLTWSQDGKDKSATLPYVKAVAGDKGVVLTLPDGSTVEVPKSGSALTEDSFDHTITKGANVADKFGVKLKDKGGLKGGLDGIEVATGAGLTKDANGNVKVDGGAVADGLAGSGLTASNGQLSVATVRLMDASGTVHLGNLVDTTK